MASTLLRERAFRPPGRPQSALRRRVLPASLQRFEHGQLGSLADWPGTLQVCSSAHLSLEYAVTTLKGVIALSAVLVGACGGGPAFTDADRDAVVAAVDSATRTFQQAERARDAERTIAHMAPSFYMYNDGVRQDYETTVAQIRASMPTFRHFEPAWSDVEVTVLGPEGAVVSLVFRDSIIDASGALLRFRGTSTLAWRRFGPDWHIVYADAVHYPVTAQDDSS